MANSACVDSTWTKFGELAENLTTFISSSIHATDLMQNAFKRMYDKHKRLENAFNIQSDRFVSHGLVTTGFNDEQIWQQVDSWNEKKLSQLQWDLENVSPICLPSSEEVVNSSIDDGQFDLDDDGREKSDQSSAEASSDDDLSNADSENDSPDTVEQQSFKRSVVDDEFFCLDEMERFADAEESMDTTGMEDMWDESCSQEKNDNQKENIYYNDFFGEHNGGVRKSGRSVTFAEGTNFGDDKVVQVESTNGQREEVETKSSFEIRQERANALVRRLEEENLSVKPWQLTGEVSSVSRPENSLIEENLLFDRTTRLPPIVTPQLTEQLEALIVNRIKNKAWDDPERKVKPTVDLNVYKNELILEQQKSKLSLAEVYEQEYLKKTQQLEEESKNPAHEEIRNCLKELFFKLDALTNFHYVPRMPEPEVELVSNLPTMAMEEVAPVSTSDATLLAPEEVKRKLMHVPVAKEERSSTDKKRALRKKKKMQSLRRIRMERKASKSGSIVPKSTMDMLGKAGTVKKTKLLEKSDVASSMFFNNLQKQMKKSH